MKKYFPVLRKCTLFDQVADEDLIALLGCLGARVQSYQKKDTVLSEGETATHIGILLSGSVQMIQHDYFGNRSIVSEIHASQLFAESFACAGDAELPVSVIANEPSEVMFINCNRVMYTCANACAFHGKIIYNLMKTMANKNILFHQKLQITSKRTTREKLMTYLLQQAKRKGKNSFEIPFNRQELADYLEVDRSGLSAEISKLRDEGILKSDRSRFELLQ
ncbi:MAG: Crp/Fnr family transcriptional regulator [Ruminococcaceae bacterium]|nr:Crp/Fnr family transcriptional regulator [Oscillospiraceae bacterium]